MHGKFIHNYNTYMAKASEWDGYQATVPYGREGTNQYVYIHLLDRWGNMSDIIEKIPNIDRHEPGTQVISNGQARIVERGGSGIESIEVYNYLLGAGAQYIKENRVNLASSLVAKSTRTGSQWSSTDSEGVTVYMSTTDSITLEIEGITRPTMYSIMLTDKAGWSTAATITTDAEGVMTLTIDNERQTPQGELEEGSYDIEFNGATLTMLADMKGIAEVIPPEETVVNTVSEFKIVTTADGDRILIKDADTNVETTFTDKTEGVTKTVEENGWITWTVPIPITKKINNLEIRVRGEGGIWYDTSEYDVAAENSGAERPAKAIIKVTPPETIKLNEYNKLAIETYTGTDAVKLTNTANNLTYQYGRDSTNVTVTDNADGTSLWEIEVMIRTADVKYSVNARLNQAWDANGVTWTGTAVTAETTEPATEPVTEQQAVIISATAEDIKVGTNGYITVVTNGDVTRVKLTGGVGSSKIYTKTNKTVIVTANANGTLTWQIPVRSTAACQATYTVYGQIGSMWEPVTATVTVNFYEETEPQVNTQAEIETETTTETVEETTVEETTLEETTVEETTIEETTIEETTSDNVTL